MNKSLIRALVPKGSRVTRRRRPLRLPPGPRGVLSGWPLLREPLAFIDKIARDYGDIASVRICNLPLYLIGHPDGVRHVLQDNQANYVKAVRYKALARIFGEGLITSEGAHWQKQRRLIQPAFHRLRLEQFARLVTDKTLQMVERWSSWEECQAVVDVSSEMMRLALQIVGQSFLSLDVTPHAAAINGYTTILNERLGNGLAAFLPWLPTLGNLRFRRAAVSLRAMILEIVSERRHHAGRHNDLLSLLLDSLDDDADETVSDAELRDQLVTLMIAGHETTANVLSWTWYLLAQNPEAEQQLHHELDVVLDGKQPTFADLGRLHYTLMVINEAMRLYPPVWCLRRHAIEDDEIMGYYVPKGHNVLVSQWLVHRNPIFWSNPRAFRPERFAANGKETIPRYAFFPFGGGPRTCIASQFALTEAQLILACIAQRFRLRIVNSHPVVPQPLITLRARYGIKVVCERRRKALNH